jgi:hypothetical protein
MSPKRMLQVSFASSDAGFAPENSEYSSFIMCEHVHKNGNDRFIILKFPLIRVLIHEEIDEKDCWAEDIVIPENNGDKKNCLTFEEYYSNRFLVFEKLSEIELKELHSREPSLAKVKYTHCAVVKGITPISNLFERLNGGEDIDPFTSNVYINISENSIV